MEKLLITGTSGFIGSCILKNLIKLNKYELYTVTSKKENIKLYDRNVKVIVTDLLSDEAIDSLFDTVRPEYVIHLAWSLDGNDEFQLSQKNIEWLKSSIHMIKKFNDNHGKHFIFAGSSSEYNFCERPLFEEDNYIPLNLYGVCKKNVTDFGIGFSKLMDFKFTTVRYFSVYGPGDKRKGRAITYAINTFFDNKSVICKNPNNIWDYIYVDDAAAATVEILKKQYSGIVNISSGVPVPMKDVFSTIARLMNREELLSFENMNSKGNILYSNNDVLTQKVGYKSSTSFEEGMKETINWNLKLRDVEK